MRKSVLALLLAALSVACSNSLKTRDSIHDLQFTELAKTWDEGIPLGNGVVGALVWQKDSALRMSLDGWIFGICAPMIAFPVRITVLNGYMNSG